MRSAWVVVVRNPFDNVATMSLRRGRRYDRIRINAGSEQEFRRRLERQQGGSVPAEVHLEMVDDYASLCSGLAAMKQCVDAEDWLEIRHEDLVATPVPSVSGSSGSSISPSIRRAPWCAAALQRSRRTSTAPATR